ncbi:DHHA1 domain-containing protein [bacterium]|nr:DHHA1 domain-containing protein [bacterium]
MLPDHKPEVIITHESDLDGFVSGLLLQRLAKEKFGTEPRLLAYNHQTFKNRHFVENAGWVADFSVDKRMDKARWLVVDHHVSRYQPSHCQFVFDTGKSAGLLAYELCKEAGIESAELDRLVRLNDVADLFMQAEPEFEEAQLYAGLIKSYGFWNMHSLIEGKLEKLIDHPLLKVMETKRKIEDPIGFEWSSKNIVKINDDVGFVSTTIGNTNLIIHQLLETGKGGFKVLATLFRKQNGTVIASFRSRDGSALDAASKLQGGGHPNAAGATLPRSVNSIAEAISYLGQVLNPQVPEAPPINDLASLFDSIEVNEE